jgi:Leucine-rich repeat (LRR) protein
MVGSLPKTIAKLHHLEHINLAHNKLNGTIPFGLFSLPSLERVYLHFNKFTGGLPPHVISRSLKELNLYKNELDGYVNQDSFTFVKGLALLDLSNNKLNGSLNLYALLSILPYLGTLNFINSGLIVTDDYTGRVNPHAPLVNISLASCKMTMFPLSIRSLKNLVFLDLSNNFITHLPSLETGKLNYLYMGSNKIQGPILSSVCNLVHLRALDISHNNLSGRLPSCLGDLSQIEMLDLSRNLITREIPPSFENIKRIAELNLSQNHLEGCIQQASVLSIFGKDSFHGNFTRSHNSLR